MTIIIKPLNPSKTLANFLGNNTSLPSLVWWIILKFKYNYEESNLEINRNTSQPIHRLRSGVKYISDIGFEMNTEKWFNDCYKLFKLFKKTNNSNIKRTIYNDKLIYNSVIHYINFVMNWIHIIVQNAKTKSYMHRFLHTGLYHSITTIYNDIHKPNLFKSSKYERWTKEVVEELKSFKDYIRCPCGWTDDPTKKCNICINFEQFYYNYDSYFAKYMKLRSGKLILKKNCEFKQPIIIHKVYRLV